MKFNGYLKLRIGEAVDLKPTTFSLRHSVIFNKASPALDPYIVVKVDDYKIGQTHIKQKTNTPTYNEEFCLNVMNGKQIEMAVFHDTPIGYDDFVANCVVQFDDLIKTSNTGEPFEGWVSAKWELCDIFAAGPSSGMWDPMFTGCSIVDCYLYQRTCWMIHRNATQAGVHLCPPCKRQLKKKN